MDVWALYTSPDVKNLLPVKFLLMAKSRSKIFTIHDMDKSQVFIFRSNSSFLFFSLYMLFRSKYFFSYLSSDPSILHVYK